MQANLFTLNCSAHMLALMQDVVEAPGGSAIELLPSTNSPQDEAQVVQEQASEDAPVLQGDILPKAQVCSNPVRLALSYICLCLCLCLHSCLCPCIAFAGVSAGAGACAYCLCLCSSIVPAASYKSGQYPLPLACCPCWSLVPFAQLAGSWQGLLQF